MRNIKGTSTRKTTLVPERLSVIAVAAPPKRHNNI